MSDQPNWDNLHYNNDDRIDIHVTRVNPDLGPKYLAVITINGKYISVGGEQVEEVVSRVLIKAHEYVSGIEYVNPLKETSNA